MLTDRIEPMLFEVLLHHSTTALPVLIQYADIFNYTSQFTEYLAIFFRNLF